jgi:hypothetical protein
LREVEDEVTVRFERRVKVRVVQAMTAFRKYLTCQEEKLIFVSDVLQQDQIFGVLRYISAVRNLMEYILGEQ